MRKYLSLLLFFAVSSAFADVVRITFTVLDKEDNDAPVFQALVHNLRTDEYIATNEEGVAVMDIVEGTTNNVQVTCIGRQIVSLKVDGSKTDYTVSLKFDFDAHQLGEAKVTAKKNMPVPLKPRPLPASWVGDTLTSIYELPIEPRYLFPDRRIVGQPFFLDETTGKKYYTEPAVLDAAEYNRTQRRLWDFGEDGVDDPLHDFVQLKNDSMRHSVIGSQTTRTYNLRVPMKIIVRDGAMKQHSWLYGASTSIETYTRVVKQMENDTIGIGVKAPFDLFKYDFHGNELTDAFWFPKVQKKPMETKDDINIRFASGKSVINYSDSLNVVELAKMQRVIDDLVTSPGTMVNRVSIVGTASPEGSYAGNVRLAEARMRTLLNIATEKIPAERRTNMRKEVKSRVCEWSEVVTMLREDGLDAEADRLETIANAKTSMDVKSRQAMQLPFYQKLKDVYLPRLRTVGYEIEYEIRRELRYDELLRLFDEKPNSLADFEFFKLYRAETDTARRLAIVSKAFERFPKSLAIANDYSAYHIDSQIGKPQALKNFAGRKYAKRDVPMELNENQIMAQLMGNNLSGADTLEQILPVTADPQNRLMHAIVRARFREFNDNNWQVISATCPRNAIIYLLAVDSDESNQAALAKCGEMTYEDPVDYVVKAVCVMRDETDVNAVQNAAELLKRAMAVDPSVEKRIEGQYDLKKPLKTIRNERQ